MYFVLIKNVVAERPLAFVEGTNQIIGLPHLDQVQQITHKTLHRSHRLPVRPRHLRQGMKNLIDQRVRIDQIDCFPRQIGKLIGRLARLRFAASLWQQFQLGRFGNRRIIKTGQRWLTAQARHAK